MLGRLQVNRCGCIQHEVWKRPGELAECHWSGGGRTFFLPGAGVVHQTGCTGGREGTGHKTAEDLNSQVNSELSIRSHVKGEVRKLDAV